MCVRIEKRYRRLGFPPFLNHGSVKIRWNLVPYISFQEGLGRSPSGEMIFVMQCGFLWGEMVSLDRGEATPGGDNGKELRWSPIVGQVALVTLFFGTQGLEDPQGDNHEKDGDTVHGAKTSFQGAEKTGAEDKGQKGIDKCDNDDG